MPLVHIDRLSALLIQTLLYSNAFIITIFAATIPTYSLTRFSPPAALTPTLPASPHFQPLFPPPPYFGLLESDRFPARPSRLRNLHRVSHRGLERMPDSEPRPPPRGCTPAAHQPSAHLTNRTRAQSAAGVPNQRELRTVCGCEWGVG